MTEITARRMHFDIPQELDLYAATNDPAGLSSSVALSLSLPYLEPYLIRTMRVALDQIADPELAADVRAFSAQEGHHFRAHAQFNRWIVGKLPPEQAAEIGPLESALKADYERFSQTKSLRFNPAYAEGFEAMTCSAALAMAEHGAFEDDSMMPGGEIWAWHMAEEIEHRTVAFNVLQHLVGSYPYRIVVGTWSQWHYVRYIGRFARCMSQGIEKKKGSRGLSAMDRDTLKRYLRTWSPWYDPAKIDVPPQVEALLARYSALTKAG